ncbi:hypothetical protein VTN96DRAFT_490 [Rasamsonia emersonii]
MRSWQHFRPLRNKGSIRLPKHGMMTSAADTRSEDKAGHRSTIEKYILGGDYNLQAKKRLSLSMWNLAKCNPCNGRMDGTT